MQEIVIIGGGIIGAATAFALSRAGADHLTVIESGGVAGQASGRSFGWLNASSYQDAPHFALRHRALEAWRRYAKDSGSRHIYWPGSLVWEHRGDRFQTEADALIRMNYSVQFIDRKEFVKREPEVANPPEHCLFLPEEGVIETAPVARDMLIASGARLVSGCQVRGIETVSGRVAGVRIDQGIVPAHKVIVAAGTACPGLLAPFGIALPMLHRPGLLMRSRPVGRVISHILASPEQELRQDANGCLIAPTTPAHQTDNADRVADRPDLLAQATLLRLSEMLPGQALDWQEVMLAARPVPGDGLPVIGACGPDGLFLAVMHSGATLAVLAGALLADEVLNGTRPDILGPYRPERFDG